MRTRLSVWPAVLLGGLFGASASQADPRHYDARFYGGRAPARHYDARFYGGSPTRHHGSVHHNRGHLFGNHKQHALNGPHSGFKGHRGGHFAGCHCAAPFFGSPFSVVVPTGRVFVVLPGSSVPFVHAQPLFGPAVPVGVGHGGCLGYHNARDFYSTDKGPRDYARFYQQSGALQAPDKQDTPIRSEKPKKESRRKP